MPIPESPARKHGVWKTAFIVVVISALVLVVGISLKNRFDSSGQSTSEPAKALPKRPLTKTVAFSRVDRHMIDSTNDVSTVTLWTDSTVQPGETLYVLIKRPDGEVRKANAALFTQWQPEKLTTSSSFSWFFGGTMMPGFGTAEADSATAQMERNLLLKPVILTAGQPLFVFSVTNASGAVIAGLVEYSRELPSPRSPGKGAKPQALVRVTQSVAWIPSITCSAQVPPGYALRATANMAEADTHNSAGTHEYRCTWFNLDSQWRNETSTIQASFKEQFEKLQAQGSIPVVLGQPKLVFSVTNSSGDVHQGFLELVGPPSETRVTSSATEVSPQEKAAISESKLVISSAAFTFANADDLKWGFKAFVPPDRLATFLFVQWTNGVPTIDRGFSAYFKVGKTGGIDAFCSLSCHGLESELLALTEAQRAKALADMHYPASAGLSNAVQWNVNLGTGATVSGWKAMPPLHRAEFKLPQSVSSGHQRVVRLVEFDKPEGAKSNEWSGVELRVLLEPLTLPAIRMLPDEVDHTNHVAGRGLARSMEETLELMKTLPVEP